MVPLRARFFSPRKSRWRCAPRSVQRPLTRPWDASGAPREPHMHGYNLYNPQTDTGYKHVQVYVSRIQTK
eukprot:6935136-Prymnesium_polylepis.1